MFLVESDFHLSTAYHQSLAKPFCDESHPFASMNMVLYVAFRVRSNHVPGVLACYEFDKSVISSGF